MKFDCVRIEKDSEYATETFPEFVNCLRLIAYKQEENSLEEGKMLGLSAMLLDNDIAKYFGYKIIFEENESQTL